MATDRKSGDPLPRVRAACGATFLGLVLLFCGCQRTTTAEQHGTVTVDGKLLEKGSIAYAPVDGKGQTAGGEITGGKYSVKLGVGLMKVEIRYPKVVGKKKDYDAPGGKYYDLYDESLPAKYNNRSELTVDVPAGSVQKDWELRTK